MNADPLAPYRRSAPPVLAPEEPEEYVAFLGRDRVPFLEIRPNSGLTHSPQNLTLVNVAFNRPAFSCFIIHYHFMDVFVNGRNLKDVISAVQHNRAVFIQSFNKDLWPEPKGPKAPFIESIEFEFHDKPGQSPATPKAQSRSL